MSSWLEDYPLAVFRDALRSLIGRIVLLALCALAGAWVGLSVQHGGLVNPLDALLAVLFSPFQALFSLQILGSWFVLVTAYFLSATYDSTRFRTGCCLATLVAWALCGYAIELGPFCL